MRWLQAKVMLSITRAPTCVPAHRGISIDSQDEGKNINTALSQYPVPIHTSSVWGQAQ